MLTAALLAALLAAGAEGASTPPTGSWVYALEARLQPESELSLLRLDPRTLVERGRYRLARDYAHPSDRALSPDRRRLAVVDWNGDLRIFDLVRLRPLGPPLSELTYRRVAWVSPNQVVALASQTYEGTSIVSWIDVRTAEIVRSLDLPGVATGFARVRGSAFIVTQAMPFDFIYRMSGAPPRLYRVDSTGARRVGMFSGIRVALEPWRVGPGAILPPLAAQALAQAREDLARREGTDPRAIEARAVVALSPNRGYPGYRMVLRLRENYFEYRASVDLDGRRIVGVSPRGAPTDSEPGLRDWNLLRLPPGTWTVEAAKLLANPSGSRAFLVTPSRVLGVASVARRTTFRYRRVGPGPYGSFQDGPVRVGGAAVWQFGINGRNGMALLNLETARMRVVPLTGCDQESAARLVLTYGETPCSGVTAFGPDGRRRFQLLRGEAIQWLQANERYAYAFGRHQERLVSVIDLARGRVVHRMHLPSEVHLLVGTPR